MFFCSGCHCCSDDDDGAHIGMNGQQRGNKPCFSKGFEQAVEVGATVVLERKEDAPWVRAELRQGHFRQNPISQISPK